MRDIGGEALIGVDPGPKRSGGHLQVARQDADLILPFQQIFRHAAHPALALAHIGRGGGELQDRVRQGLGEVEREQRGQQQGQHEEHENGGADLEQPLVHLPRLTSEQHDAHGLAAAPGGLGHADKQPAIGGAANIGGDAAFQRHAQLLPPVRPQGGLPVKTIGVGSDIHHHRRAGLARQQGEQALIQPGQLLGDGAARDGRGQGFGHHRAAGTFSHAAIGDHQAGDVEEARLGIGRGFDQASSGTSTTRSFSMRTAASPMAPA